MLAPSASNDSSAAARAMIKIIVLGAAAGGGIPQWNCGCDNCRDARGDRPDLFANQASIAISGDGEHWFLINASPDMRHQIARTPALWPQAGQKRHSPIAGVILTNGEIDAITGLLSLREGSPFTLYAHPRVHSILSANAVFDVLKPGVVTRTPIDIDAVFSPCLPNGAPSGLRITPFTAPGKQALFLEGKQGNAEGDTIGLLITDETDGRRIVFLAACAAITPQVNALLANADTIFFDGTLWQDDEMVAQGLSEKTGQRMGHIAMEDALAALSGVRAQNKFFLHINNSNPAWRSDSEARAQLAAAGWSIPSEGMEIVL